MKKTIVCIVMTFCFFELYSQDKNCISAEIDGNGYYYFMNVNRYNNFNYGYSFILSRYIHKIKVSFGINYAKKNSYLNIHIEPTSWLDSLNKIEYDIKYLNFPIFVTFDLYSFNKVKINCLGGVVFDKIINYDITTHYQNKSNITEKNIQAGQKLGLSFRFGIGLTKAILPCVNLNLSPFIDYKVMLDYREQRPDYRNLTDDRFSFGLKLGVEYLFNSVK
jgi:hypothetical protein